MQSISPEAPVAHGSSSQPGFRVSAPSLKGTVSSPENAELLDQLFTAWKQDPTSVDPMWRSFFEGFELGMTVAPAPREKGKKSATASTTSPDAMKQARIAYLLFAYRTVGHYVANLDPLGFNKHYLPELDLKSFHFTEEDLDRTFDSGTLAGGGRRTLREIITCLKETYCGNLGVEYMHIQNFPLRRWVRDRVEGCRNQHSYSPERKKRILNLLICAEHFEKFLHTRFVGQKRFSLEGGETLIPMLDAVVQACPSRGVTQICMGMAHRGRLNVLANVLGKDYKFLFNEFAETYIPENIPGLGDVKYHLGYEGDATTESGEKVGISLAPNPSHLELVNPVVEGKARAWQRLLNDTAERRKVLPILIHGDAAFIGQGIVWETLNMSQLDGYKTGGTVHVVINNQIGFTTGPQDARSTVYCTSLAKGLGVPIFHVNGDDPLSAVLAMEMAFEFRQVFQKDVVIDLVCYRRLGHNEGDEPSFTQPLLYKKMEQLPLTSETCARQLIADGTITGDYCTEVKNNFNEHLEFALHQSKAAAKEFHPALRPALRCPQLLDPVDTTVSDEVLRQVGITITEEPKHIKINTKLKSLLKNRRAMAEGALPVDWSFAEHLAFGTLLVHGNPVRLSGQDSRRGTFSQRHSVFYDVDTRERWIPLKNITPDQATFCVYNSPLSEAAVLGFDYGYSLDFPNILMIWEAQFGDFINGAQAIIDQYISSAETKWGVQSGITLLLPHGYHGQGPEHSSARLERFLQLCAEDNMVVAYPTSPLNYYHLLRRQALRKIRKPLIVMAPKGLLRDKNCVSNIADFAGGTFQEVLSDPERPAQPDRLILCTGKVYYDLLDYRRKAVKNDTTIVRIEQLYPLHERKLVEVCGPPDGYKKIVWCQEEPKNMGAWFYLEHQLRKIFGRDIEFSGRRWASSPATGSHALHDLEQETLVEGAFFI